MAFSAESCPTTREGVVDELKSQIQDYVKSYMEDPLSALQMMRHRIVTGSDFVIQDEELLNEAIQAAFPGKGWGQDFMTEDIDLSLAEAGTSTFNLGTINQLFDIAESLQSNDALDQDQQGYSGDDNNSPSLRVGDGGPKVYDGYSLI